MTDIPPPNDPTGDVARLIQASTDSLTDGMIERLSVTAANGLEVVDKLNDEDTRDAVHALIDGLTELHRTGALDTAFQLITLIHGCRDAVTDSMVERLFAFMEHMVTNLANDEIATVAHNAKEAMSHAAEQAADHKPTGGLMSTLSMLNKPETQQALQFMLAFACEMRALSVDDKQD
jgi:uncharacterized protein YjgD (DUF1641 family)